MNVDVRVFLGVPICTESFRLIGVDRLYGSIMVV